MTERARGFWAGLVVGAVVAGGVLVSGVLRPVEEAAWAQGQQKYTTTIVLENERVIVKDVTFPPGVLDTGMHTHALAHVGVILTKGELIFTEPGGKTERVTFEPGTVGFREANATHQVANPGSAPMRVIEVELKK
jgi:quercetin dioxygenase-like cupin family protein